MTGRLTRPTNEAFVPRTSFVTAVLFAALAASPAAALPPPQPVSPFEMTGFIEAATLDAPGDLFASGTVTVNGTTIVVPRNTILQMPAAALTWQQVFQQAPAPYGPTQSGMALSDTPPPLAPYEVHVYGNRVGDTYIAGLLFLAQNSLLSGQGYINWINYGTGEFRVGGIMNDPTTGQRVIINDPLGKFGRAWTPDQRFTIDEDNPTVRTGTAYPMCMPRVDPASGTPDPLCPERNRPRDPTSPSGMQMIFTMPAPAAVTATTADPRIMAPFEVGDYVTYAGILVHDGTNPTAGPAAGTAPYPTSSTYIAAYQVIADVGIFTAPGTNPVYVATDVTIIATGGVTIAGIAEAAIRTRFEGFASDASHFPIGDPQCTVTDTTGKLVFNTALGCSIIDLTSVDHDPCGVLADTYRSWGSIDVDQGPPTGAVMGRWRFRPPSKVITGPASGTFDPPTREVRAVLRGATPTLTTNGLTAGLYTAPIFEILFPENIAVGSPVVPLNFEAIPFLAQGSGFFSGAMTAQLSPWPGAVAPAAATCAAPAVTPPTAVAGANQTVASGALVTLNGSASTDPNGQQLTYQWTQIGTPAVTLSAPTSAITTFTAPIVPAGSSPLTLTFQLVVSDLAAGASAPSTVSVTVSPANPLPPVANAGANVTVNSNTPVQLNGTGSTDPNNSPLTYAWSQVSPAAPLVLMTGANTAQPTFTTPVVTGAANLVLTFSLTVVDGFNLSSTASVTVTVLPVQAPIANAGPKQTVISGSTVKLNGLGSTDPQNLPLTYLWKTGGPITNFSSTTSPTPTFTAPTLKAGSGPTTFTEGLVVNNGFLTSKSQSNVTITVVSGADTLAAVNVIYRLSQQRLTVDVSSTLNGTASDGSWQLFLQGLGPGGTPIQMVYSPALGAGVYEAIVNGIPQPASVTVTSSLGATATFPVAVR